MSVNIRDRKSVQTSLDLWRRRVTYRRGRWHHWKSVKQTPHARVQRSRWFGLLKTAKWYVDRREKQLAKLGPKKPKIIDLGLNPRGKWGPLGTIRGVVGHYTAGARDSNDTDAAAMFRAIDRQHDAQWGDGAGYHYGIGRSGTVFIIRPVALKGAHTTGQNTGHVGVVMHGTTGDQPSAAQQASVAWLAAHAHTKAMPKRGRTPRSLASVRWSGHNDWYPTACPGDFKTVYTSKGKKR